MNLDTSLSLYVQKGIQVLKQPSRQFTLEAYSAQFEQSRGDIATSIQRQRANCQRFSRYRQAIAIGRAPAPEANIIVGVVGALVFGALFGNFNFLNSPMLNEIAGGTIGAVILLYLIGLIRKIT